MKKLLSIILVFATLLAVGIFSSCSKEEKKLVIGVPDGAPTLAVYNLLKETTVLDGKTVEIKYLNGASNVATAITSNEVDVAVMPTNIAAKIYNKGVDVKLLSVNVFGVLYMVGNQPISSLNELLGKVVVNIGRGGTPDLTLKAILNNANIECVESETAVSGKVALNYVSAGSEAIAKLKAKTTDYAILGEPVVTQANKVLGTQVVLDLQDEWAKFVGEDSYMQAGVVLNKSTYENTALVNELIEKLKLNSQVLKDDYQNIKDNLTSSGSSISVDFTLDTVNRLNIGYLSASEAKENLENYFTQAKNLDSAFIGGNLPSNGFYYGIES